MKATSPIEAQQSLGQDYLAAMHAYLEKRDERGLEQAYELGRRALEDGMGVVELAGMYHDALSQFLQRAKNPEDCSLTTRRLGQFFIESISPYEMTHRGFRDAQTALRHLNEALEAEARRIAHALHDEAGQLLVTVHFALDSLGRDLPPSFKPRIEGVHKRLSEVEGQVRRLSHELRPTMLDDVGLLPALDFMAQGVAQRSGLAITVQGEIASRLQPLTEIALYRIVQEALNNVARHAKASEAMVSIEDRKDNVVCSVKDDGVGFNVVETFSDGAKRGLGLLGIQERIKALGGSVDIRSSPGSGTEILASIPCAA